MQEDMQRLIEFKNELESLIEEQNKEIDEKTGKSEEMLEILREKEDEDEHRNTYIDDIEKQL